jgi:hypothetical protein
MMVELKGMKSCAIIKSAAGLIGLGILLLCAVGRTYAAAPAVGQKAAPAQVTDLSAQTRRPRARTRIRVVPLQRQPAAWDYPRPGDVSWPGPGALRDCVFRLEQEYRPSGTVIVPRQSCWWVRG